MMKYIIFDIDGTLTDTKAVDDKCFIKAFKIVFNINIENIKWSSLKNATDWGITEEIIQRKLERLPTEKEYNLMQKKFLELLKIEKENNSSQFLEVPNANHFFNLIKEHPDYEIGIATGAWESSALLKLKAIGIDPKGIAFANSSMHKSRAAISLDVINQLSKNKKIAEKNIIYFGDGEWDYLTCQKLGIHFIGIDVNNSGKLKKLGAKKVYKNYRPESRILSYLKNIL